MHEFNSHSPTFKSFDQIQKFLTGQVLVVDLNRYLTNAVSTLRFPVPANNTPQNISRCRVLLATLRPFQLWLAVAYFDWPISRDTMQK